VTKVSMLLLIMSCSSYTQESKLISGEVHYCNTVGTGKVLSLNYSRCFNLESVTPDTEEMQIRYTLLF